MLGQLLIVDLDKFNTGAVGLVVDVLDLRQHSAALFTVVAV